MSVVFPRSHDRGGLVLGEVMVSAPCVTGEGGTVRMESGRVLLGSPSGLVVGRKASRDPGPRACVARPTGTRCPLALCCFFLLHSTLGVSPVPVIVGALLSQVALGTPALRSFPMPSPEPLPGGHLHSHGTLLLPTSPREMGPAVGLGCPPPERGLGGGRRPPAFHCRP